MRLCQTPRFPQRKIQHVLPFKRWPTHRPRGFARVQHHLKLKPSRKHEVILQKCKKIQRYSKVFKVIKSWRHSKRHMQKRIQSMVSLRFLQRFTCIPQTQFPHCGPPWSRPNSQIKTSQTMSNLWMGWWIHGRTDGWTQQHGHWWWFPRPASQVRAHCQRMATYRTRRQDVLSLLKCFWHILNSPKVFVIFSDVLTYCLSDMTLSSGKETILQAHETSCGLGLRDQDRMLWIQRVHEIQLSEVANTKSIRKHSTP